MRWARGIGAGFVSTLLSQASTSGQAVIGDDNASSPDPTTEVGYIDLLNLMADLDPAYLVSPQCYWAMNFNTLRFIFTLKDKYGHPIIKPRTNGNGDYVLFEKPVAICPSMPDLGPSNKPLAFGAFDYFHVREVKNSLLVRRYGERYASTGIVAFEGFWRLNAGLMKAATADSPIKVLQNAA